MILYITDNPIIKNKIPGAILTYQLYDWRIKIDTKSLFENEEFNIIKKNKNKNHGILLKNNNTLICIISRSNYKLLHELNKIKNKVKKFYYWDTFDIKKEVKPNFKYAETEFMKYMQRGYLSSILHNQFSQINLQRLEQFQVITALNIIKAKNIELDSFNQSAVNSKNYRNPIDIFQIINSISIERDNIIYIIDKLMYHARKNDITDPFTGKFIFKNKNNSLYKIFQRNKNKPTSKISSKIKTVCSILQEIIPLVDILKTLRFISKNTLIDNNLNLVKSSIFNKKEILIALEFISSKKWDFIYKNNEYSSFNIFPPLSFKTLTFKCPICNSSEFRSSPVQFWCSDNLCPFRLGRVISPAGIPMKISQWDMNRLLTHKSTIIKNKRGGYSRFYIVENDKNKGKYNILPYIEKNDINPD